MAIDPIEAACRRLRPQLESDSLVEQQNAYKELVRLCIEHRRPAAKEMFEMEITRIQAEAIQPLIDFCIRLLLRF